MRVVTGDTKVVQRGKLDAADRLVFDLDGTLAETAPDIMRVLNLILERETLPPLPPRRRPRLAGVGRRR